MTIDLLHQAIANKASVLLTHDNQQVPVVLTPIIRKDGHFAFQNHIKGPEGREFNQGEGSYLRIMGNGRCDLNGGRNGPMTAFTPVMDESDRLSLKSCKTGLYLSVQNMGLASSIDAATLTLEVADPDHHASSRPRRAVPVVPDALSPADLARFREDGFVILRNAVEPELIRDALRAINHQMGQPDSWQTDENGQGQLKLKTSTCGEAGVNILNQSSKFWSALNILLGEGNVSCWERGQQVALRFPQDPSKGHLVTDVLPGTRYHIDGMGENKLCPFSLLCGVALSDQSRPNCGNLHVFPGAHLNPEVMAYYRDRIQDKEQSEGDPNKPNLGKSVQVLLEPGDVVIAHQLLAHRAGINTSEHIRYQLFYRVSHKDHQQLKESVVENPWVEFDTCIQ